MFALTLSCVQEFVFRDIRGIRKDVQYLRMQCTDLIHRVMCTSSSMLACCLNKRRFRNTQWFGLNKQIHISPARTCGLFTKSISEKAGRLIVHNLLFQRMFTDG